MDQQIKTLSTDVINLISLSDHQIKSVWECVTELIYNALDADSTNIAVRIDTSTFTIQIVDNGSGLSEEQLESVGKPFSTNKLFTFAELQLCPKYYGFRGKTIANLAQISRKVIIHTRPKGTKLTFKKVIENDGESTVESGETVRPIQGTTLIVEDLFYDLGMHRMDTQADMEKIVGFIRDIAILHHNVSFSLKDLTNNDMLINIDKTKSTVDAIKKIFNLDLNNAKQICWERKTIGINGLINLNIHEKGNLQLFFVNKRPVSVGKLQFKINKLLQKKLNSDDKDSNWPQYFMNIEVPVVQYDINGKECAVEFKDWPKITNFVKKCLIEFLEREGILPEKVKSSAKKIKEDIKEIAKTSTSKDDQGKTIIDNKPEQANKLTANKRKTFGNKPLNNLNLNPPKKINNRMKPMMHGKENVLLSKAAERKFIDEMKNFNIPINNTKKLGNLSSFAKIDLKRLKLTKSDGINPIHENEQLPMDDDEVLSAIINDAGINTYCEARLGKNENFVNELSAENKDSQRTEAIEVQESDDGDRESKKMLIPKQSKPNQLSVQRTLTKTTVVQKENRDFQKFLEPEKTKPKNREKGQVFKKVKQTNNALTQNTYKSHQCKERHPHPIPVEAVTNHQCQRDSPPPVKTTKTTCLREKFTLPIKTTKNIQEDHAANISSFESNALFRAHSATDFFSCLNENLETVTFEEPNQIEVPIFFQTPMIRDCPKINLIEKVRYVQRPRDPDLQKYKISKCTNYHEQFQTPKYSLRETDSTVLKWAEKDARLGMRHEINVRRNEQKLKYKIEEMRYARNRTRRSNDYADDYFEARRRYLKVNRSDCKNIRLEPYYKRQQMRVIRGRNAEMVNHRSSFKNYICQENSDGITSITDVNEPKNDRKYFRNQKSDYYQRNLIHDDEMEESRRDNTRYFYETQKTLEPKKFISKAIHPKHRVHREEKGVQTKFTQDQNRSKQTKGIQVQFLENSNVKNKAIGVQTFHGTFKDWLTSMNNTKNPGTTMEMPTDFSKVVNQEKATHVDCTFLRNLDCTELRNLTNSDTNKQKALNKTANDENVFTKESELPLGQKNLFDGNWNRQISEIHLNCTTPTPLIKDLASITDDIHEAKKVATNEMPVKLLHVNEPVESSEYSIGRINTLELNQNHRNIQYERLNPHDLKLLSQLKDRSWIVNKYLESCDAASSWTAVE